MKLLVLYEELAPYFVSCINHLAVRHSADVLIICKKDNPVAPFDLSNISSTVTIIRRETLSEQELLMTCQGFGADILFLGGWAYSPYLKVVRRLKFKSVILGFDNHWSGSLKQRLFCVYFKFRLKRFISFAFVPGTPQKQFALKLGFPEGNIFTGAYCADYNFFYSLFQKFESAKQKHFPRVFLFVGRYAKEKGISDLWEVFIRLQKEHPCEWELWCAGKGDVEPVNHPKIKHLGFVQPAQMPSVIKNAGVFVLPSTFEPWGVVVHEFTAAGMPVIISSAVGAAEIFVQDGKNGFLFNAGNREELFKCLLNFTMMSENELVSKSESSVTISSRITPDDWSDKIVNTIK